MKCFFFTSNLAFSFTTAALELVMSRRLLKAADTAAATVSRSWFTCPTDEASDAPDFASIDEIGI